MEGVTNEAHVLQVTDDRVSDMSLGIETKSAARQAYES